MNALTTASEADDLGQLLVENKGASLRVANTGTIDPYVSLWGERPLVKQGRKFLHPAFKGSNTALESRKALFKSPKIVVAKMALRCEAFLDSDGGFAGIDVNTVYNPSGGYTLEFLIGYMHFDVAAFCHRLFFKGLAMAGGYLPFQAPHLRVLPIPDLSAAGGKDLQERVERAVGRILVTGVPSEADLAEVNAACAEFHGLSAKELADILSALGEATEATEVDG
ncbi:hypothetical protein [Variovorax sp. 38R]|uniref:hypothetical protein n=1 Tax=Variovorax sp. 38R TaxID=2774875 RepID=UPI00177F1DBD|nr:hypothetical protein [Variovorax sp. 38R]QOF81648.1 hypothetical protein IG196_15295 [Variovorax sp. 38R]